MERLYSISFLFSVPALGQVDRVDKVMGSLGDWVRFSPLQWYLYSSHSKQEIVTAVETVILPEDQFILSVVQSEVSLGRAMPWVWTWINDKMVKMVHRS